MVVSLGKVFGQKITETAAKGIISAAASTLICRRLAKMIPIVGWGISAAVAAGITEAIGWTSAVDFAKQAKNDNSSEVKTELSQNQEALCDKALHADNNDDGREDITSDDDEVKQDAINVAEQIDDNSLSNDFSKAFKCEEGEE